MSLAFYRRGWEEVEGGAGGGGGGGASEIIQRLLEEAFTQRACHFLFVVCFFVV